MEATIPAKAPGEVPTPMSRSNRDYICPPGDICITHDIIAMLRFGSSMKKHAD